MLSFYLLAQLQDLAGIILPAAGVLLIAAGLMISLRKRRARSAAQPSSRDYAQQLREAPPTRAIRGDLETLMVEIEQMARRLGSQLDNKAVRLERLLEEANQTLAALEEARRQPMPPPAAPASGLTTTGPLAPPPASSVHTPSPPQAPRDPLTRSVYQLADQGLDAARIAESLEEHVGKIELILALRRP